MTFVLVGLRGSGKFLLKREPIRNINDHALQDLFPLPRGPRPARELLRKFRSLGLPPLLFPALQVGRIRGGGLRVHLVLCPERLPPLPLDLGLARGGKCLWTFVRGTRALLSLLPVRELERGRLLVHDGLPLLAPLPRLLLPAHRSTLRDVMSREKFRRTAPLLDPPVFPDLRIEEQGRIAELALGRIALVTVAVVLALLPVRGQEVESIGGSHPLGRCSPTSSSAASGRNLRITLAVGACALVLGETGLDPRIDTGLGMTSRGLLTTTDHIVSVRVPLLAGRLAVTRSSSSPS